MMKRVVLALAAAVWLLAVPAAGIAMDVDDDKVMFAAEVISDAEMDQLRGGWSAGDLFNYFKISVVTNINNGETTYARTIMVEPNGAGGFNVNDNRQLTSPVNNVQVSGDGTTVTMNNGDTVAMNMVNGTLSSIIINKVDGAEVAQQVDLTASLPAINDLMNTLTGGISEMAGAVTQSVEGLQSVGMY